MIPAEALPPCSGPAVLCCSRSTLEKKPFMRTNCEGTRFRWILRFLESREIEEQLHATGFRVQETIERETYGEDVEYPSRRAYIFAEKPQLRG